MGASSGHITKHAWYRLDSPGCPVSLVSPSSLLACLLWFVPVTSACFSECVLVAEPQTVLTRQTRQAVHAIKQSIFNIMSMECILKLFNKIETNLKMGLGERENGVEWEKLGGNVIKLFYSSTPVDNAQALGSDKRSNLSLTFTGNARSDPHWYRVQNTLAYFTINWITTKKYL